MKLPKLKVNPDSLQNSGNRWQQWQRPSAAGAVAVASSENRVATGGNTQSPGDEVLPVLPVPENEWQHSQPTEYGAVASVASVATEKQSIRILSGETHPHWLAQLASILKCDATYLLANGYIDWHDLIEQDGSDPKAMADLIRSNPAWQPQIDWRAVGKQYARATALTAATAEPEWLLVRDAYHNHWAACLDCHPPANRYCATGAALKARYEAITDQELEVEA